MLLCIDRVLPYAGGVRGRALPPEPPAGALPLDPKWIAIACPMTSNHALFAIY